MPSTRSGRTNTGSSPAQKSSPSASNKRKAEAISPSNKESKSERPAKEQKTIEETIGKDPEPVQNGSADSTAKNDADVKQNGHAEEQKPEHAAPNPEPKQEESSDVQMKDDAAGDTDHADSSTTNEAKPSQSTEQQDKQNDEPNQPPAPEQPTSASDVDKPTTQNNAVQDDAERKAAVPSNILEKGVIYFFTRGRVGIDEPGNVQDLQRSFFVLRPIPKGGKLTDGGVQDAGNNRLFALPKKVWPKSGRDRFMVFVEKAKVSIGTLKEEFFQGSEYSTQTSGVRHTPPVTPIGEGVYAITSTGGGQGTTHLAYMLTIPSEPGQLQQDVGIAEKGSFVLSLKNPESSGPSYASLPQKPDYPKEFIDEFRGRGWMPVAPKHLDYPNAQLLLIGEDFESSSNLDAKPEDKQDDKKETPEEELQKLEDEDEHRVESLKGDDTIFIDLGISKKEYSAVQTTW